MGDWDDDSDKVAMTPEAIEVRARMAQEWAERYVGELAHLRWTVRQHFEHDVPALLAAASAYRAGQAATPDGPRRWALPDEPGPEVTAVRNAAGGTWDRDGRGWTYQNFAFPWVQLLRDLGPLTDATPAADGQDGDGRG